MNHGEQGETPVTRTRNWSTCEQKREGLRTITRRNLNTNLGEKKKKDQALRERRKQHWEILAWLTNFLEKNKENWKIRRIDQEKQKAAKERKEQWERKGLEAKREQFKYEERMKIEMMGPEEKKKKSLKRAHN